MVPMCGLQDGSLWVYDISIVGVCTRLSVPGLQVCKMLLMSSECLQASLALCKPLSGMGCDPVQNE